MLHNCMDMLMAPPGVAQCTTCVSENPDPQILVERTLNSRATIQRMDIF